MVVPLLCPPVLAFTRLPPLCPRNGTTPLGERWALALVDAAAAAAAAAAGGWPDRASALSRAPRKRHPENRASYRARLSSSSLLFFLPRLPSFATLSRFGFREGREDPPLSSSPSKGCT